MNSPTARFFRRSFNSPLPEEYPRSGGGGGSKSFNQPPPRRFAPPLRGGELKGTLMKKILILFLCLFTVDSFASGIASNSATAPCNNTTLETYSGNSNLSADWQPNTIQLRWYDNNTLLTVQSAANTCVYDDTLAIPSTAPTRTGYTFAGWTVQPQYDFSTLTANPGDSYRYGKGVNDSTDTEHCMHGGGSGGSHILNCNDGNFADLDRLEWKTLFSWGTIYGMSICSSSSGESYTIGTPNESSVGQHCWCKATGYVPSGSSVKYKPAYPSVYVVTWKNVFPDIHSCYLWCATNCAYTVENDSVFRSNLFSH